MIQYLTNFYCTHCISFCFNYFLTLSVKFTHTLITEDGGISIFLFLFLLILIIFYALHQSLLSQCQFGRKLLMVPVQVWYYILNNWRKRNRKSDFQHYPWFTWPDLGWGELGKFLGCHLSVFVCECFRMFTTTQADIGQTDGWKKDGSYLLQFTESADFQHKPLTLSQRI